MTFLDIETSKDLGAPYELYEFVYGPRPEDSYKYANTEEEVPGFPDFVPTPIRRDAYKTSGKAERDQMNITLPTESSIAQMILPYPPPYEVYVTIWAGHFEGGLPMVVWMGRVLSNAFSEAGDVVLTCESLLISLKRLGVRRRWQIGCPLVLYSKGVGQCNAEREDFTVEAEVLAVIDGVPVFANGWNQPFQKDQFKTGMLRWESPYGIEYRSIRQVQDDRVVFIGQLRGIEPGQTVELILGCNRRMTDCEEVFDNIKNFGGQPWIPLTNPVRHHNFW